MSKGHLIQPETNKNNQEKTLFVKAIDKGISDIKQGKTMSLAEAKKRLDIK